MHPQMGQIVRVRSRRYLVEDVAPPEPKPPEDTLIRLSCLEDDAQGEELQVLWEREVDAQILASSSWDIVAKRGFDEPHLFSAYLHTLRWNCVTSTDPKLFQAPYRAGIEVMAYQLEPLRKALLMPRVNLFIADDVGLGKTIEAGLILREMLMRQKVRQIVIVCPPSVVLQWQEEMERRFGLTFLIYDRTFVAKIRRERGYSINPWNTHSRFIISQSLLRDENYASPLRNWLGTFASGSMLILDEAHNAAPASSAKYAIDSKLTRIVRDLAPRFEHRLFLSATPHNGHSNSFAALLEILDPQRFCRGVPIENAKQLEAVMVRRLKSDLRAAGNDFPRREVIRVSIDKLPSDAPELQLSRLLQEYRQAREERLKASSSRSQHAAAMLVLTSLQKRLLSSIHAFARTLYVHRNAVNNTISKDLPSSVEHSTDADCYPLLFESPGADDDRAELSEEEVLGEEEAQVVSATLAVATSASGSTVQERKLLEDMAQIASQARHQPDSRIRYLVNWLRDNLCPGIATDHQPADPRAPWASKRVLIFTEYTDTKAYLQQQLQIAIAGTHLAGKRIETFHGGMGDDRREEIKRAFNATPDEKNPLRILIATDAAREGVNLQNHCADLFHFDIPWNPSRMEQRNGRIDRKLQQAPVVRCHYFVLPQRMEDRVLDVLVSKTRIIQEELGSLSPVVVKSIDSLLRDGIRHEQAPQLEQRIQSLDKTDPSIAPSIETIKLELEESRERNETLTRQLQDLRSMLKRSQDWLALSEQHFRNALSASLHILHAPPLQPVASSNDSGHITHDTHWTVPALDQLSGADPTWATTLDTLRPPRQKNQSLWEWRRESPLLPVIFRDPGTLSHDAVHLHLEHRLVQRLLGRFISQGFVHHELTRACVCMTEHPIPLVILLGRLSLYGDRASRLHDEIVAAAAEWSPPQERGRSKLKPLTESAKQDAMQLLETSLASESLSHTSPHIRQHYLTSTAQDVEELRSHLEKRANFLDQRARKTLTERGDQEAQDMVKILEAQRKRIQTLLDKPVQTQRVMDFLKEELRQIEADRRYWPKRLQRIEIELEEEPSRIRASYEVKMSRVEPVGVVYLVPRSG